MAAAVIGSVRSLLAAVVVLAMGGCAVGPDFQRPAAPSVASVASGAMPATTASADVAGGQAQHFDSGADIPAQWWALFHSAELNALVEQALAHNPDLKAAQAALAVARENTLAGRGAYAPSVGVGVSASREQDPPGALAPVPSNNAFLYNLFTPQVSVSYVPDVFGRNRRTVESLEAQQQAVRFQALATRITLSTNVVAAAVQQASLRAQIATTRESIATGTRMVELLRYQLDQGYAGRLDLAAQESQLAQWQAALPPLLTALDQQNHLLAVLAGRLPGEAPAQAFDLANLHLPRQLPVSLPSALVAQRPDVRQAEANMHAASAQIGVAIADRLPNISLTANAGSNALAISQLFKSGTGFWSLGVDLAAPIFEGGSLRHQERAAKAAYVEAAEQYRGTVLTAFQNVADTLAALQHDAEGLQAAAKAADAARLTLELSQRQYKDGYASYLSLLGAEQADQQAHIALVQAQASRYVDTAALFQAMGGGWWHDADTASTHATATRDSDEK